MGLASADFDEDGDEDLFVTNLVGETNTLYVNDGRGSYDDRTPDWGLAAPSRPFTGFGTGWFDMDNDGRLDLFVANGAVSVNDRRRGRPYPYQQRNSLLRQQAGTYLDVSSQAGPALSLEEVSRSAAFGDLDNDGDTDVLVTNNNGPARLLRNDLPRRHHWLGLRLLGVTAARDAQGAAVRVIGPGGGATLRRAHTDGSYLSASDPRVFVGLGPDARVAGVEVEWRRGEREAFDKVPVDRMVTLQQGQGRRRPVDATRGAR